MSKYEPIYTSHGNYKCGYCNHKVWKSRKIAMNHIETNHAKEAIEAYYLNENARLRREEERLKGDIDRLKKPTVPKKEYYDAIWYCSNCLKLHQGGLPKNTLLENVCCGVCGVCALHIVTNVSSFWTKS